jgi:hypothetical protein
MSALAGFLGTAQIGGSAALGSISAEGTDPGGHRTEGRTKTDSVSVRGSDERKDERRTVNHPSPFLPVSLVRV